MKKLNFMTVENELSREEMKNIMAGSGGGTETCQQFHEETGCYPTFDTASDCVGKDGRTYSYASSSGSCA